MTRHRVGSHELILPIIHEMTEIIRDFNIVAFDIGLGNESSNIVWKLVCLTIAIGSTKLLSFTGMHGDEQMR